ncbi:MAG: hypothetical protein EBR91_08150 [Flavobacteriia bacterium]|nr:hypothetical protein [Flavobacteriia bacterium]
MNKELARDILYNYLQEKIENKKELPIWDEIITTTYENNVLASWTFRGILQYLYNLEDKSFSGFAFVGDFQH